MNEYYPYYCTFLIVTLTINIPIYFQKMAEGGIGPTGSNSDTNLIHSSLYSRHSQASQKTMFASSTGAGDLWVRVRFTTYTSLPHNRRHFVRQKSLF